MGLLYCLKGLEQRSLAQRQGNVGMADRYKHIMAPLVIMAHRKAGTAQNKHNVARRTITEPNFWG